MRACLVLNGQPMELPGKQPEHAQTCYLTKATMQSMAEIPEVYVTGPRETHTDCYYFGSQIKWH